MANLSNVRSPQHVHPSRCVLLSRGATQSPSVVLDHSYMFESPQGLASGREELGLCIDAWIPAYVLFLGLLETTTNVLSRWYLIAFWWQVKCII